MLPKAERLKKNRDFSAVYKLRKSVANQILILYTGRLKTSLDIPPKVGFVVSKKIHKHSAERNLIKRRLREAYKQAQRTIKIPINQWESLIFVARPKILEVNYKEVYDSIVYCLKKAHKQYGNRDLVRD